MREVGLFPRVQAILARTLDIIFYEGFSRMSETFENSSLHSCRWQDRARAMNGVWHFLETEETFGHMLWLQEQVQSLLSQICLSTLPSVCAAVCRG
jgi:hypothetical protein